jgi:chaperonin cofactor prefoldin
MIMAKKYKIEEIDAKIQEIKKAAKEIEKLGGDIEAVKKNLVRLRASTKMLELNISDVKLVM